MQGLEGGIGRERRGGGGGGGGDMGGEGIEVTLPINPLGQFH